MNDQKYDVVFTGKFMANKDSSEIRKNLRRLFASNKSMINSFLSEKKVTIKRQVDIETASKYVAGLKTAGIICGVRESDIKTGNQKTKAPVITESNDQEFVQDAVSDKASSIERPNHSKKSSGSQLGQSNTAVRLKPKYLIGCIALLAVIISTYFFFQANSRTGDKTIQPSTIKKLKNATVYIEAKNGDKGSSGTGFLIYREDDTGLIITNNHVIDPGKQNAEITVTFNSGEMQAYKIAAELHEQDKYSDLAILKVESDNLPVPLNLKQNYEYGETQEVLIVGFPFGKALSTNKETPSITISKGNISSKRLDDYGQIFLIQLDGDINPGNSGGPIVASDGEIIGVAVLTISQTNIGFAIPAAKVFSLMNGKLVDFIPVSVQAEDELRLIIEASIVDPLLQIDEYWMLIAPEEDVTIGKLVDSDNSWKPLAEGSEKIMFEEAGYRKIRADIPIAKKSSRNKYYAQAVVTTYDGKTTCMPPFKIVLKPKVNGHSYKIALLGPGVYSEPQENSNPSQSSESQRPRRDSDRHSAYKKRAPKNNRVEDMVDANIRHLDGIIEDVIPAKGGEYLIFRFDSKPQIRIYEPAARDFTKELSVPFAVFHMAANKNYLYITTSDNEIKSIELESLESRSQALVPDGGRIKGIATGWDSQWAPIMVMTSDNIFFLNPESLVETGITWYNEKGYKRKPFLHKKVPVQIRAAADGKSFTYWWTTISPEGVNLVSIQSGDANYINVNKTGGYLAPNYDGSRIYTSVEGIYNSKLRYTGLEDLKHKQIIPGIEGQFFMIPDYDLNQITAVRVII